MTTKIKRAFEFQAGVHFDGKLIMNRYQVMTTMLVNTDSIREQNVAMDRLKYLFGEMLMNVVFVHSEEKKVIEKYEAANIKVCVLPEEPYDQIITLVLLVKMNAIAESRLSITEITLRSDLSDGVMFVYEDSILDVEHPFHTSGWWSDNTTNVTNTIKSNKKEKIVKLVKTCDWHSLNLEWKEKETVSKTEILFTTDLEKT